MHLPSRSRLIISALILCWPSTIVAVADEPESASSTRVSVNVIDRSAQAEFAVAELRQVIQRIETEGQWQVTLRLATGDAAKGIRPEGYRIESTRRDGSHQINILAVDPAGIMYGGLEVAEIIRTLGIDQVKNDSQNPYMQMRGTKFNIPLDARTPSYTDVCDAAQINIPEMWSFEFWKQYIDTLARYRFNYVSLWNLHPFPSLVKVPKYPDVALNDVWRSKVKWEENYPLQGREFVTEEILRDVEVVKSLTIDEKIDFWRRVMAYGKSRNVDLYIVTWNIFTYGTGGKYGITDDFRNKTTIDYFRQSVRQLLLTYPDLAGIGLTTGENMPGASTQEKEDWAMATYGRGVLDVVQAQPDRRIRFIHREHQAKTTDIARTFQPLVDHPNVDFIFSFKYAKAHVYSATKQPYHRSFVNDLGGMRTIWTLRNDDVFYFRWGAPDFVREFVKNIPHEVTQGYYYGSDQYIWGREFLQRDIEGRRELEIDKHWFQWMLWGRFAYDPELDNDRLKAVLAERFGLSADDGSRLFDAWQSASLIYPLTTGFHWGALDFQWYIEGCQSRPEAAENTTGFHDVNRFITLKPHPESNNRSIPDYVKDVLAGRETIPPADAVPADGRPVTPLQLANLLDRSAARATTILQTLPASKNAELNRTLSDIRIVAHLGSYYADKIRGATQLALFRASRDEAAKTRAVEHLTDAARHWHDFATLALEHHKNPLWTNRVGHVDWRKNYQHVLEDVRIAGGDPTAMGLPASVDVESEPVPPWSLHTKVDPKAQQREIVRRTGDWTITGKESVRGKHIVLDGNLVLAKDAVLTLQDCLIEIVGRSSREHLVDWRGGKLITRDVTIGGAIINGRPVHTVFHLYDGLWDATDTTVQYAYGVSFGSDTGGTLKGTRFKAGPRPDAVIASGKADITLIDSDFPIALGIYTHKGGACSLDLPVKTPVTRVFDAQSLTPGVEWRMELKNTTADHWFVFLRNIGMENASCEVTLGKSDRLIVSLLGHNLTGDLHLSNALEEPARLGSLTLRRAGEPPGISMYALYFSGDKTDISVSGATHICELMHRGGKLQLTGTRGMNELSIGCTTLELSGSAAMTFEHVHLGRPLTWQSDGALGEANVTGNATMTGTDVSVRGVRFHTRDQGRVYITGVTKHGTLETRIEGGAINLKEQP